MSLCFLTTIAVIIWLGGPYVLWDGKAPLLEPEKRIYFISFLVLLWLLKFLIVDLAQPFPISYIGSLTQKKLKELEARFYGALRFLKKATLNKQGKVFRLNHLPWYLLIGPEDAGKTALLANADIHFVLQRQFQHKHNQSLQKSDNCDWWVTKDACIIDVPGQYLTNQSNLNEPKEKGATYPSLWRFFLRLLKKHRNNAIQGIVLALPLPEIMKGPDNKKYDRLLAQIFERLVELQKLFNKPIPCQLVITKCDQLSGFVEFFSNTSLDETDQTWGITLPILKKGQKIADLFTEHFDRLIKNLNQQLLFRLHQERNPIVRPYIKDFPLQVERMKRTTSELLNKIHQASLKLSIRGVYLTSAMQVTGATSQIIDEATININERAVQLFQAPPPLSRAFFIKQFMLQGFGFHAPKKKILKVTTEQWGKYLAYTMATCAVGLASVFLIQDFQRGLQHTYALQDKLTAYQLSVQQYQSGEERLERALYLLNTLQQSAGTTSFKLDLSHLLTFYSQKSKQNAKLAYDQSLQNILLPEIKNSLGEYLKNPIIKNTEKLYASLQAYLMLGDPAHFQPTYILNISRQLFSKSMSENESLQLMDHLNLALTTLWHPQTLDLELIDQTRQYFGAMPPFRLGYIILKNNHSYSNGDINLKLNTQNLPLLFHEKSIPQIPVMFTMKAFSSIIKADAMTAAKETLIGNWVLGTTNRTIDQETINALTQQLQTAYVNNYINEWEKVLENIRIPTAKNLLEEDQLIVGLISNGSPLLQLLQTLHDNTYFEPIVSASPKLQSVGLMMDKNNSSSKVLEILASLHSLHQYIQTVLNAENQRKAAYDVISNRVKNLGTPDAITRLRLVAVNTPQPIKSWLEKIANTTWHFLMQDASRYLDTAWQNQVLPTYNADIANRFPFNSSGDQEVAILRFIHFFGNPGTVINFYNDYLQAFIDTSHTDWHWKMIDNNKLPFSEEMLRRLQQAIRIHQSFFPNNDNKLSVQFSLKPYNVGKKIKVVKLNIDDAQFIDQGNIKSTHVVSWPSTTSFNSNSALTSVEVYLTNHQVENRRYPGTWGWLRLLNQSFESVMSKKQMLLNLSMSETPVQYLLLTNGDFNPFLSLNLNHFNLPQQITKVTS
jgi:type VI secretion system protein ImpL